MRALSLQRERVIADNFASAIKDIGQNSRFLTHNFQTPGD
jgi:hypothetical protein